MVHSRTRSVSGGGTRELHDDVVARVRDPLGHGEAGPGTFVDAPAPGEEVGARVRQHRRERHREVHSAGRYGPLPTTASEATDMKQESR